MDNHEELYKNLLKADHIDPARITDSERAMLGQMLEKEKKRFKRLSWVNVGVMWVFALAMLGLIFSERIFESLPISFSAISSLLLFSWFVAVIVLQCTHNRKLMDSGRRVGRLELLVSCRRKGLILVAKKDGKKVILWPRVLLLTAALWLFFSLGIGAGYSLLRGEWDIFSDVPLFMSNIISIGFVFMAVNEGLRTPLDLLEDRSRNDGTPKADK